MLLSPLQISNPHKPEMDYFLSGQWYILKLSIQAMRPCCIFHSHLNNRSPWYAAPAEIRILPVHMLFLKPECNNQISSAFHKTYIPGRIQGLIPVVWILLLLMDSFYILVILPQCSHLHRFLFSSFFNSS